MCVNIYNYIMYKYKMIISFSKLKTLKNFSLNETYNFK